MALSDIFRKGSLSENVLGKIREEVQRTGEDNNAMAMALDSAKSVGHIAEIENGYLITLRGGPERDWRAMTIYVPTLEKIGEALAAHKTKQKFLHEPEVTYTVKQR